MRGEPLGGVPFARNPAASLRGRQSEQARRRGGLVCQAGAGASALGLRRSVGRIFHPAEPRCGQRYAQPRSWLVQQRAHEPRLIGKRDGRHAGKTGTFRRPRPPATHQHRLGLVAEMMAEQQVGEPELGAGCEQRRVAGTTRPLRQPRTTIQAAEPQQPRRHADAPQPGERQRCFQARRSAQAMVDDERGWPAPASGEPGKAEAVSAARPPPPPPAGRRAKAQDGSSSVQTRQSRWCRSERSA